MTVAAVILASDPAAALADADGLPRVRREADAAWAGGATPVVVVADDPDGALSAALAGTPSILAEPARAGDDGGAAQVLRGLEVAVAAVVETDAALVWPVAMAWIDPETVTSLIEAHGTDRDALLRPAYAGEAGWPVVVPLPHLEALRAAVAGRTSAPDAVSEAGAGAGVGIERVVDGLVRALVAGGVALRRVELGDPGTVIGGDTPRGALPDYQGPPQPQSDHVHEWGAAVADVPEDAGPPPRRVPFEEPG